MREFSPGARHPDIELIQLGLSRGGYPPGAIDGVFGPLSRSALDRFRKSRNLELSATITERDWRALVPFLVGYVIRTAQPGDTLPRLAEEFQTTVQAIETANPGLRPESLPVARRLTIPLGYPVVPTTIRFSSKALYYTLLGLTARYPKIRQNTIGHSVLGVPLPVLTFGEGTHQVSFNAAHHGNEWITTPLLLKFLEEYAQAQANGGQVADLEAKLIFSATSLHLIPMLCPDGVDIATGAIDQGPFYEYALFLAEHYPHIPFPAGWKANGRGVDLNLQYPAGWERAKEIKFSQGFTRPGPRDYVGKGPLSEPESRALHAYTLQKDFSLTLSYHSQGQVIYWRYLDFLPPGSKEIGKIFSKLSGYALEETPYTSGHAGYKDWFISHFNRPGYTIEVGSGQSPLPLSQFDKIYKDNKGMLALALVITAS